jgi:hypothetical protein
MPIGASRLPAPFQHFVAGSEPISSTVQRAARPQNSWNFSCSSIHAPLLNIFPVPKFLHGRILPQPCQAPIEMVPRFTQRFSKLLTNVPQA